jgi:hypothetical protein
MQGVRPLCSRLRTRACLKSSMNKRLLGLPINGRNVMQLVSLSAGVINGACQRHSTPGELRSRISVAGQRDNTSVVLIDGMEISGRSSTTIRWPYRHWTQWPNSVSIPPTTRLNLAAILEL